MNDKHLSGVAIASSGLGHVTRGIEAWATDMTAALREAGLSIRLFQGAGEDCDRLNRTVGCWPRSSRETSRWLTCLPPKLTWRFGMGSPYAVEQTTFGLSLLRHLRRDQIRLLHVQDPLVARLVQRAHRIGLVPTKVILGHGTEEPLSFLQRLDYVQHLAPWHLQQARNAGVNRPGWTAIPNFVDVGQFSPGCEPALRHRFDIPSDAIVVLVAAAIKRHHKRIDYVIDEFAALRHRRPDLPAWLVIAGAREKDTDDLIELGRRRLSQRVRFEIGFPRADMPRLYRMANVFVLGSLLEMMPIALLEASASGLPCLTNNHPVMTWMSGPGGQGGDFTKQGALARLLEEVLSDEPRRKRFGGDARQHCLNQFSKEVVIGQMIAYYESILQKSSARRAA